MKMQFNFNSLLSVMALLLTVALPLTGCNNDDPYVMPVSEQLANQDANSEPGALTDADDIKMGIERLFGDADGEPVAIDSGESISSVFGKAGS